MPAVFAEAAHAHVMHVRSVHAHSVPSLLYVRSNSNMQTLNKKYHLFPVYR
jgi:hypothetical protein